MDCYVVEQFGWTSYPNVHWASPMCAGGLLGFAVLGIFVSLFNYVSLAVSMCVLPTIGTDGGRRF
jgi:hypothetical protein